MQNIDLYNSKSNARYLGTAHGKRKQKSRMRPKKVGKVGSLDRLSVSSSSSCSLDYTDKPDC